MTDRQHTVSRGTDFTCPVLRTLAVLILSVVSLQASADPANVGGEVCASCHAEQRSKWLNSHHDLAMQSVGPDAVSGDFSGTTFREGNTSYRFTLNEHRYIVEISADNETPRQLEIEYAFGVTPLQQYLIEHAGGLQALPVAWDTRSIAEGGQRWFHLYEGIPLEDRPIWTDRELNWNTMCAACHSTGLRKNYDAETDTFETSWSEEDVSCEACHGPGSDHVQWASGERPESTDKGLTVTLDERKGVTWQFMRNLATAVRSEPRLTDGEIEVCAPCHSRRVELTEQFVPGDSFLDHYQPTLLEDRLYFADGQILEEVYVYGSFLQSRMYAAGVTCSDCHDPHSQMLRAPGNGVCLTCHAADEFNTKEHHLHPAESTGSECINCHMPSRLYMVVDERHDHSFRIPRPDLSDSIGVPNACNHCHVDQEPAWAAEHLRRRYGEPSTGLQTYGTAFSQARSGTPEAAQSLIDQIQTDTINDLAYATALSELVNYPNPSSYAELTRALGHDNPMVRAAAVRSLGTLGSRMPIARLTPLLTDPSRNVRIEAAHALAPVAQNLHVDHRAQFDNAASEYIEAQQTNRERPGALMNIGTFRAALGEQTAAVEAYNQALSLDPRFYPAAINLADIYRARNDEMGAERVLRSALTDSPESADLHHALGLAKVRQREMPTAITLLARAAKLAPDNVHYAYVYGVALNSTGARQQALVYLQNVHQRFPFDQNVLSALVAFHRDNGDNESALRLYRKLEALRQPANRGSAP